MRSSLGEPISENEWNDTMILVLEEAKVMEEESLQNRLILKECIKQRRSLKKKCSSKIRKIKL